jgi:hypothetical protein
MTNTVNGIPVSEDEEFAIFDLLPLQIKEVLWWADKDYEVTAIAEWLRDPKNARAPINWLAETLQSVLRD